MPHPSPNPHQPPLILQSQALREALKTTIRNPDPKPLHNLRSTLRRIQALLQLQPDPDSTTHFLKATKPIRQSSGTLRDLDIQLDLLTHLPEDPATAALIRHLQKARHKHATNLQLLLHKHHKKLLAQLAELDALNPAPSPSIPPARLAQTLFSRTTATLDPHNIDQLHAIRKAARISRHIAESSTKSATSATSQRFHHLHQTLGRWHDWLILTDTAHHHLPATSPLLPTLHRRLQQAHRQALKALKALQN